jgi:putative transposase
MGVLVPGGKAENPQPVGRRERQMRRFKSPEQAHDFLFAHAFIHGHFQPRRHLLTAESYRATPTEAFSIRHQKTHAHIVA